MKDLWAPRRISDIEVVILVTPIAPMREVQPWSSVRKTPLILCFIKIDKFLACKILV
jgi:hypothetical protein